MPFDPTILSDAYTEQIAKRVRDTCDQVAGRVPYLLANDIERLLADMLEVINAARPAALAYVSMGGTPSHTAPNEVDQAG